MLFEEILYFGKFGSSYGAVFLFRILLFIYTFQNQPKPSPTPENYPAWASWKSKDIYLPAEFHSLARFNKLLTVSKKALSESIISDDGVIDSHLLFLGLMYREITRVIESEPGEPTEAPDHLVKSNFGIKQLEKIEALLNGLPCPSKR